MIKTRRTKRTFSPEFKLEAIEQVVKYQRDVREVAQAFELNPDHLRKWIRLYKQEIQGIESAGNAITPEQREIQQLKAQIKRLEMEKEIPKAGCRADERNSREIIALITRLKAKWPVRSLCRLWGIHRSVYYAQVKRPVKVQRIELRSRVRAFHALSRGATGSRTISQMLRQSGVDAGRWLARRLMQECGLASRQPVKHRYRVNEDNSPALPNLLNRQFNPAAPNRAWCGDISFIRLQDKWCYLALVVDLYSRRIIGSALSLIADADLVCRALRNALETRPRDGRVLFHSDQGVQYKSNKYRRLLWHYGVMQSMSRRGNCLDNSPMERVFRSLKSEWLPKGGYDDFSHAVRDINQWINGYYNVYRPHTNNGGLPPCLHEEKWKQVIPVS
ncbi:IS3 family transposase [Salmonella enterica]|nr:IS3 family transposase [Salmonella enterica]EJW2022005.1 IS3 family transposase [Salmonella enterica]EJW2098729.1 IS3 family transposase [Salmonella enterica]EKS4618646.1 IS3 family transposase [Salmonella enterica]EKS4946894.1 IS3 family transposase [Salmonella enterica]